jgi:chromosome partitioning protein
LFRQITKDLVSELDVQLKFLGLLIGPLLAVMGFVWGRVDRAEMMLLADRLAEERTKAAASKARAEMAALEVAKQVNRVESLEKDLAIVADTGRLWKLRENAPFADYKGWKYEPAGAKIVTVGLFKGGVGKTHLASNFAAYVSERQKKPVLLIDMDFQGSLSTAVLKSAGVEEEVDSRVDALLSEKADLATLMASRIQLTSQGPKAELNAGQGLSRAWIVPSNYTLAQKESELLMERVLRDAGGLDERYRLAHVLLHPDVRREFALIIIDTPPRMTLGMVNALVASHSYIVPVVPDRVSSEAVKPFLTQIENMKQDLSLNLRPAGIVASMIDRSNGFTAREEQYWSRIREDAMSVLGAGPDICIDHGVPDKVAVRFSGDLGYFESDSNGPLTRIYDLLFDELWKRIMLPPHES